MTALTSVRRRSRDFLPGQLSTVHHATFPAFPPQTPSATPSLALNEGCRPDRSPLSRQASPLASRLAVAAGRIGFTRVRDCGSASGCSPPRLTATQLPPAALPLLVSGGLRLSLVGFMVTSFAHRGRDGALVCPAPPSEPCWRISRTRLSSQWFAPLRRLANSDVWASSRQKRPRSAK